MDHRQQIAAYTVRQNGDGSAAILLITSREKRCDLALDAGLFPGLDRCRIWVRLPLNWPALGDHPTPRDCAYHFAGPAMLDRACPPQSATACEGRWSKPSARADRGGPVGP